LQVITCVFKINMAGNRDIFQAIADPTRREIIHLISRKPQNLNSIADNFSMTRQAVSLHVKILAECGLINIKQQGRERVCQAKLNKLNEVSAWIDQYRQFMESTFDSLEIYLEKMKKEKKYGKKRK
jgi:DNA-binding transcriptional ArsR family regulator